MKTTTKLTTAGFSVGLVYFFLSGLITHSIFGAELFSSIIFIPDSKSIGPITALAIVGVQVAIWIALFFAAIHYLFLRKHTKMGAIKAFAFFALGIGAACLVFFATFLFVVSRGSF